MAERRDFSGKIQKYDETPQGGIVAPAYFTRTGVFTYLIADATAPGGVREFKELRHPSEVFAKDSLATLEGAPLTVGHPRDPVTTATWKTDAMGAAECVGVDGIYVDGMARIQDDGACQGVRDGSLREFSCGYSCDVDPTPGEYEGMQYDAIQRNIRYNHVAMGPEGWGRAGAQVRLRIDGTYETETPTSYGEDMTVKTDKATDKPASDAADVNAKLQSAEARADAAAEDVKAQTARADAAEAKVAALEAKLASATSVEHVDAAVESRLALLDDARSALGADFKPVREDGTRMSDRDVRIAAITKLHPNFKADGKDDSYVTAYFDAKMATQSRADASHGVLLRTADAAISEAARADSEEDAVEAARKRNALANANAWKSAT